MSVLDLETKRAISARMKASCERRRCPVCKKANALKATSRKTRHGPATAMACRYCAAPVAVTQ